MLTLTALLGTVVSLSAGHSNAAPVLPVPDEALISEASSVLSVLPGLFSVGSTSALKALALTVVPLDQFWAFDAIITRESSWQVFAVNPSSGAYGLAQALPADKMFSEGPDWLFNPHTQLRWAYRYMVARYGSPAAAWDFWQAHHWY